MLDEVTRWHDQVCHIKKLVDAFERFHKYSQLQGNPLIIPILNESRYLARALIDALFLITEGNVSIPCEGDDGESNRQKIEEALSRAKVAASSALHDSLDEILAISVRFLAKLEYELGRMNVTPVIPAYLGDESLDLYEHFLRAYKELSEKVANSRAERARRDQVYLELVEEFLQGKETPLRIAIDFFLSLRNFEREIFKNLRERGQFGAKSETKHE